MAEMFNEKENDYLESLNDWYRGFIDDSYRKDGWVKRFKYLVCLKNETLDHLENRYGVLLEQLKYHGIYLSDAEKIAKFADTLPVEWIEILKNLKGHSSFSKLHLK
ncbi:hypothetical protein Hanom_Chr08g00736741 [Helianthus anomalus]